MRWPVVKIGGEEKGCAAVFAVFTSSRLSKKEKLRRLGATEANHGGCWAGGEKHPPLLVLSSRVTSKNARHLAPFCPGLGFFLGQQVG